MRQLLPGILFAALWASASVATKFGVRSADPLILANIRFMIAGSLMIGYTYLLYPGKYPLPKKNNWKPLAIFALLNTTIYLGAFVLAIKKVSAGIGSLSTATSPLFIMLFSALWMKRRLKWFEVAGIILGLTGVLIVSWPLLKGSHASVEGLFILLVAMISVSVATVYYTSVDWRLPNIVINGWQVLIGGLFLLPFTIFAADFNNATLDLNFWLSVFWLIIPVSVVALQLWFYLVKIDAVQASLWLFLCPIFGFVYAYILLKEPITWYTWIGTAAVISGLYLAQKEKLSGKARRQQKEQKT
ncbi:MAG: EamA family transporter [Chitinophagaceae bacterium]